ncbi:MAG TPA: hypothetical protein VGA55_02720 [Bacteroidota bacterium]
MMKNISPTLIEGMLLIIGGIRFLGDPIGFGLLLLGGIVTLYELPPARRFFQR